MRVFFNFIYVSRAQIERRKIDSSKREVVVNMKINICKGLAVDWYGKNLYWTDEMANSISIVSVKSAKDFSKRRTLIRDKKMKPRSIAVYPATG